MKWLIVILFATMEGDLYVFNKPSFETEKECREFIMNRSNTPALLEKLYQEYNRHMPIQGVNCIEEKTFNRILNGVKET